MKTCMEQSSPTFPMYLNNLNASTTHLYFNDNISIDSENTSINDDNDSVS